MVPQERQPAVSWRKPRFKQQQRRGGGGGCGVRRERRQLWQHPVTRGPPGQVLVGQLPGSRAGGARGPKQDMRIGALQWLTKG
jgi:hypothetical protein